MTLVAVDPAKALCAVAIVLKHAALEDVVVMRVVGAAAIRGVHADQLAEAVDEALRIGEFGPSSFAPLRYKGINSPNIFIVF